MQNARKYLTEKQVAEYIGARPATVRQSRWNGQLFGRPAPRWIKLGRNVRYDISEIDRWVHAYGMEGEA